MTEFEQSKKRLLMWLLVSPCGYNYDTSHCWCLRVFSHFQEAIVTSEEIGKDYEHVEAQQKKFDDFEKVRLVHGTWMFSLLLYIKTTNLS